MLKFIKQHPLKSTFGFLSLFVVTTYSTLNYSGMCISEGRWLSDEERINKSVNAIINRNRLPFKNNKGTQYFEQIKYKNLAEFKKNNPECCKINPDKGYDLPPPSFQDRISGSNWGKVVGVNILAHYKDNNIKSELIKFRSFQTNCIEIQK